MKKLMLLCACLFALGGTSGAYADPWVATIYADYTHMQGNVGHLGCPPGECNLDGYDFDGAVDLPWTWSGLTFELNAGSNSVGGAHDTQAGGSFIWNGMPNVRLAGTAIYNWTNSEFGGRAPEWQLGGGVEWYTNPWLTLSAQAGGIAGPLSGGYVGGTIKGYVCPNFSVAGYVNYFSVSRDGESGRETDYGIRGEWLMMPDTIPLALTARWEHTDFGFSGGEGFGPDSIFVGLKLYLNEGMTSQTLVEHNRTGTLDTIGPIAPLGFRTNF